MYLAQHNCPVAVWPALVSNVLGINHFRFQSHGKVESKMWGIVDHLNLWWQLLIFLDPGSKNESLGTPTPILLLDSWNVGTCNERPSNSPGNDDWHLEIHGFHPKHPDRPSPLLLCLQIWHKLLAKWSEAIYPKNQLGPSDGRANESVWPVWRSQDVNLHVNPSPQTVLKRKETKINSPGKP